MLNHSIGYAATDRPNYDRLCKWEPEKIRGIVARIDRRYDVQALEGKKRKTRRFAPRTARHEGFVSPQERRDLGRRVCSLASYGVLKVGKPIAVAAIST